MTEPRIDRAALLARGEHYLLDTLSDEHPKEYALIRDLLAAVRAQEEEIADLSQQLRLAEDDAAYGEDL